MRRDASLDLRHRLANPLFSQCWAWCEDQLAKRFRNVEIRLRSSRGLPCGIKTWFSRPFDAVKIHLPSFRGIKMLHEAFHGQRHLCYPGLRGFIHDDAAPQTALQVVLLPGRDAQINPKPVRADFEFSISAELRRIRLQENF